MGLCKNSVGKAYPLLKPPPPQHKSIVKASCKFEHLKELKRCAKTVEIILETLALHENRNEPQEFQYFKRYNTTLRLRVTKSPSPLTFVPLMVIKVTMVAHLYRSCSVWTTWSHKMFKPFCHIWCIHENSYRFAVTDFTIL